MTGLADYGRDALIFINCIGEYSTRSPDPIMFSDKPFLAIC
jgi:hypothetical protein